MYTKVVVSLNISASGQNLIIVQVFWDSQITCISPSVIPLLKAWKNIFHSLWTVASNLVERAFTTDDHTQWSQPETL